MKMYVISMSNDTLAGFRLGGVMGTNVQNEKQLELCLDEVLEKGEIGILIVSSDVYTFGKSHILNKMRDRKLPLIVEVD